MFDILAFKGYTLGTIEISLVHSNTQTHTHHVLYFYNKKNHAKYFVTVGNTAIKHL